MTLVTGLQSLNGFRVLSTPHPPPFFLPLFAGADVPAVLPVPWEVVGELCAVAADARAGAARARRRCGDQDERERRDGDA